MNSKGAHSWEGKTVFWRGGGRSIVFGLINNPELLQLYIGKISVLNKYHRYRSHVPLKIKETASEPFRCNFFLRAMKSHAVMFSRPLPLKIKKTASEPFRCNFFEGYEKPCCNVF
jgi:hypothetical protein